MHEFKPSKEIYLPNNLYPDAVYFVAEPHGEMSLHVADQRGQTTKAIYPNGVLTTGWKVVSSTDWLETSVKRVNNTIFCRIMPLPEGVAYTKSWTFNSNITAIPNGFRASNKFMYPIFSKSKRMLGFLEVENSNFHLELEGKADDLLADINYCFSWCTDDPFPTEYLGGV